MASQHPETTPSARSSRFLRRAAPPLLAAALGLACSGPASAETAPQPTETKDESAPAAAPAAAAPETSLGVADRGVFADLDPKVQLALPASLAARPADAPAPAVTATLDQPHRLLVLYADGWPIKVYPLGGPAALRVGGDTLALRPGDRRELAPLLRPGQLRTLARGELPAPGDRDRDGIPDTLDLLVGAHKTVLNADAYHEGYVSIDYPMGDIPRDIGVCTDVVIRALRNAGLDLQREVHRDIGLAPRSYPMVKGSGNTSIDHRRVKTILPYFVRHFAAHSTAVDDAVDPLRPGDIVFLDTFPSKSGPDHLGIVSDRIGDSGLPLVINNWTDGTVTAEMDLLGWLPVTHRFRFPSR